MSYNIGTLLVQQDKSLAQGRADSNRIRQVLNDIMEKQIGRPFDLNIFQQLVNRVADEGRANDISGFSAVYSEAIQLLETKLSSLKNQISSMEDSKRKIQQLVAQISSLKPQRSINPINTLEIRKIVLQNMNRPNLQIIVQCGTNFDQISGVLPPSQAWNANLAISTYQLSELIFIFIVEQRGNEFQEITQTELRLEDLEYKATEKVLNITIPDTQVDVSVTYMWNIVDPQSFKFDVKHRLDVIDRRQYEYEDANIDYQFQLDELKTPWQKPNARISEIKNPQVRPSEEYQDNYQIQGNQYQGDASSYDQFWGQQVQFHRGPPSQQQDPKYQNEKQTTLQYQPLEPYYQQQYIPYRSTAYQPDINPNHNTKNSQIQDGWQYNDNVQSPDQYYPDKRRSAEDDRNSYLNQKMQTYEIQQNGFDPDRQQQERNGKFQNKEVWDPELKSQDYWQTEQVRDPVRQTPDNTSQNDEKVGSTVCRIDWFSYLFFLVSCLTCFRRPDFFNMSLPIFVIFGLTNKQIHDKKVQTLAILYNIVSIAVDLFWLLFYGERYCSIDIYDGIYGVDYTPRLLSVMFTSVEIVIKAIYLTCQVCMCRQETEKILELKVLQ